jgi:hypothetical protein
VGEITMIKYYVIRVVAAFIFLASFYVGFLVGAYSGLIFGFVSFCGVLALGVYLHLLAKKMKKSEA